MTRPGTIRGRPIAALLLILAGWVAARAMLWDAGAWPQFRASAAPVMAGVDASFTPFSADGAFASRAVEGDDSAVRPLKEAPRLVRSGSAREAYLSAAPEEHRSVRNPAGQRIASAPTTVDHAQPPVLELGLPGAGSLREATAHQMLWMAAQAGLPLPISLTASARQAEAGPFSIPRLAEARRRRLSADTWLLMRRGGNTSLATGAAPATYGASQAGAVLRYRLAPESTHRSAAYLRTTAALNGSNEKEAALGVSARPLGGLPVRAAAEVRATRQAGGTRFRPAAMLITEFAPFRLPFGTRAQVYGQAGYVAGKFSTGFADGQATVDRGIFRLAGKELRAGGGVWGGVQKGASRLDAGPTASMGLRIGNNVSARIAADWRFRITGNAEPSSGPALTLSAGF